MSCHTMAAASVKQRIIIKVGARDNNKSHVLNFLPVVAVTVAPNGDVKFHFIILVVRLRLPQVPLDA